MIPWRTGSQCKPTRTGVMWSCSHQKRAKNCTFYCIYQQELPHGTIANTTNWHRLGHILIDPQICSNCGNLTSFSLSCKRIIKMVISVRLQCSVILETQPTATLSALWRPQRCLYSSVNHLLLHLLIYSTFTGKGIHAMFHGTHLRYSSALPCTAVVELPFRNPVSTK